MYRSSIAIYGDPTRGTPSIEEQRGHLSLSPCGRPRWTNMGHAGVTIAGVLLDHRLYTFGSRISSFEHAHVALGGESFVAPDGRISRGPGRFLHLGPT